MADTVPPPAPPAGSLAEFVRRHDPDRFLCALFAPPARREALFALVAYNHELARAREAARTPMAALIRLQWWRDAVEEAAAGKPPRRHEVAEPLARAIGDGSLGAADLLALADAREAEAEEEGDGLPGVPAFHTYLRGTAGALAVVAGRLLGAPPEALPGLQRRGTAYGATGVLRAVPALARLGRCLLPADALAAHGLTAAKGVRDPTAAALGAVAADLLDAEEVRAPPPERLPPSWIAAALPAVLARRDARRLRECGVAADPARTTGDKLAVTLAALRGRS
ncbi:MAG: squalene/phytoene synthase family protein [Acetobacteraceae bacterium]|nr:squalene/phytoene synthase family protein [Acetobacteraceae bacterium]